MKSKTKTLDAEGCVPTMPRQIVTNPIKKGKVGPRTLLGGMVPYIEDDYNNPKKLVKKELEYHRSKV